MVPEEYNHDFGDNVVLDSVVLTMPYYSRGIKTSEEEDITYENLIRIAIDYSDGIIIGSENVSSKTKEYLKSYKNPILDFQPKDSFSESYTEFYNNLFD